MDWVGPWLGGRGGGLDPWFRSPSPGDIRDPLSFGSSWGRGDDTAVLANANVDWLETENTHIFRADLPGVRKEDVKVQVDDGNILQISGERTKEVEDVGDKWHRVERRRGSFVRRFRLPENANLDDIKCSMEDGVLTVVVPKKEVEQTSGNVRYIDIA